MPLLEVLVFGKPIIFVKIKFLKTVYVDLACSTVPDFSKTAPFDRVLPLFLSLLPVIPGNVPIGTFCTSSEKILPQISIISKSGFKKASPPVQNMSQQNADPRLINCLWTISTNRNLYVLKSVADQWQYEKLGRLWNATWKKKFERTDGKQVSVFLVQYNPVEFSEESQDMDNVMDGGETTFHTVVLTETLFTLFGNNVVKNTEHLKDTHPKTNHYFVDAYEKAKQEKGFNKTGYWFKNVTARFFKITHKEYRHHNVSVGSPLRDVPSSSSSTAFGPQSMAETSTLLPLDQISQLDSEEQKKKRANQLKALVSPTASKLTFDL